MFIPCMCALLLQEYLNELIIVHTIITIQAFQFELQPNQRLLIKYLGEVMFQHINEVVYLNSPRFPRIKPFHLFSQLAQVDLSPKVLQLHLHLIEIVGLPQIINRLCLRLFKA